MSTAVGEERRGRMKPSREEYRQELQSPLWKLKRQDILKRDDYKCRNCSSGANLQVHHRCYLFLKNQNGHVHIWNYPERILVTLCEECHNRGHKEYKVPTHKL